MSKIPCGGFSLDDETLGFNENGELSVIIKSSTPDSTKKFKITVDDSGTITATEVVT